MVGEKIGSTTGPCYNQIHAKMNRYNAVQVYLSLTLLLLNTTCTVLANSVDPDQLAS